MSGKGKYTTYTTGNSARKTFLEKLFKGSESSSPPFLGLDQENALLEANSRGNIFLRASTTDGVQTGDEQIFPLGVDMTFMSKVGDLPTPPNTEAGKDGVGSAAGLPANSFVPDLSSPSPDTPTTNNENPQIKASDIKPNVVLGTNGTKNPSDVNRKVYDANEIGSTLELGKSGANV